MLVRIQLRVLRRGNSKVKKVKMGEEELREVRNLYSDHLDIYVDAAIHYLERQGYELDDILDIIDFAIQHGDGLMQQSICRVEKVLRQIGSS